MDQREFAVVVAGGIGTRMRSNTPKQFLLLKGRPVLMHTLEAFRSYSSKISLILVLPEKFRTEWDVLVKNYDFTVPHQVVAGGNSRFQSVRNGLNAISADTGLVAVHDGVRPLVSEQIIAASYRLAALHGSAVAAVRLKESIRITDQDTTKSVDRSRYRLIQTPQTFDLATIKRAFSIEETADLTDEASVAEKSGVRISLFEGSYENLKITTPEDLIIAESLINTRLR